MRLHEERFNDFSLEKIDKLVKKDKKGYILQVNVEYPKKLRKKYSELLFLAEKMKIGMMQKRVPNFEDKRTYVVHIKYLNQALKHVLKMKKVHWAIKFEQRRWMKPGIILNTKLRTAGKSEFEKDFVKLMNNRVFRKTMKNIRNHKTCR